MKKLVLFLTVWVLLGWTYGVISGVYSCTESLNKLEAPPSTEQKPSSLVKPDPVEELRSTRFALTEENWHDKYIEDNCAKCPECCYDDDAHPWDTAEMDYTIDCVRHGGSIHTCYNELPPMRAHFVCAFAVVQVIPKSGLSYQKKVAKMLPDKFDVCLDVVHTAQTFNIDPALVAAMTLVESKFEMNAVSSAGAVGPLQIIPKYHCPKGDASKCDWVYYGVEAVQKFLDKYPENELEMLCHYNSGSVCNKKSREYARIVMSYKLKIDTALYLWLEN